ncbi:hypothetical protein ACTL6P_15590 [Endozoicomonas acroporae]|uniref:hypothetical protein n=2 Tax=Endozoicomonas acroporae TaxID=1701104 RepID=UPI000C78D674|nr:hypothetical protein [Endozoicomonas acroporae]
MGYFCLLITAFSSQADQVNRSEQHKPPEALIIGVEDTAFYPHYTTSKAGEYTGYARDLFDQFQQHSGIRIEYRPMPVEQLFDALVFDPGLPHTRGTYHLSTIKYPGIVARFNEFLQEQAEQVADLKDLYAVEKDLDNGYLGMETWKEEWLARKRVRRVNSDQPSLKTVSTYTTEKAI